MKILGATIAACLLAPAVLWGTGAHAQAAPQVEAPAPVPPQGRAQSRYSSLVVYGDSYADNGNLINGALVVPGQPYPRHTTGNVGFLGFLAYPTALQGQLGLPDSGMFNYAYAGADSGPGAPPLLLGFGQQIDASLALGQRFGENDLVVINIGGNDGGASTGGLSLADAPATAATAAANIGNGVRTLVNAGARNFMINTFDDPSIIPNVSSGMYGQEAIAADRLYGSLLYAQEEAALAPLAQSGVRIFTFNLSQFGRQVDANPALYGFTNVSTPCQNTPACATPTSPGQYTNATFDGLHLTTGAFLLAARYMDNLLLAPTTFPGQVDFAQAITGSFAASTLNRLDAGHYAPRDDAKPFSFYVTAAGDKGEDDGNSDATGYHYNSVGGTLGFDYQLNAQLALGAVFSYSSPNVKLDGGAGHYDTDSYQGAVYASYTSDHWVADALAGYGRTSYDLDRPGIIDTIRGNTHANSFSLAAKAAYLFDLGLLRAGPLAGFTYTHSKVNGYTESGDPLLTFNVGSQALASLTGSAGVQVRLPFEVAGHAINPYFNLTAEHDFHDGDRTLEISETQSPLLPIFTRVEGDGTDTYGRAQLGVSAALTDSLSLVADAGTTFGRDSGYDLAGNIGLSYRF